MHFGGFALAAGLHAAPVRIAQGADIQAALNHGDDVLLQPAGIYSIHETLRFVTDGQSLRTGGAGGIHRYATLRTAPGALGTLLDAGGKGGVTVENIILDGNRDAMVTADGKVAGKPFTVWGKTGGDRQTLRRCVILNARCADGWAAVHVLEGCAGFVGFVDAVAAQEFGEAGSFATGDFMGASQQGHWSLNPRLPFANPPGWKPAPPHEFHPLTS